MQLHLHIRLFVILIIGGTAMPLSQSAPICRGATDADSPSDKPLRITAEEVFDGKSTVIFQDDFQSGKFGKWQFSQDANYDLAAPDAPRIEIMDAPDLGGGRKAVRFAVQRAPNSFRSEISLPHEQGFCERWYAERMYIPKDWILDPTPGNDIVMQWHAVPGNWRATFPNLEISIGNANWYIRQSYGAAQTHPTRTQKILDDLVQPGAWVSWVIHAKWSPDEKGLLQIWKDGKMALELKGPNVYSTIGVQYTPYLKIGIYHPEWHIDTDRKKDAFDKVNPPAKSKVIYVTDVKVGNEHATYEDVAPKP